MAQISSSAPVTPQLRREVGFWGAVMMGFYAIIGTGVFVGIGIAAGIAGPAVLLAILVAGLVALCNGLTSFRLAESNSASGSAYEHGYRYLHPALGFIAGWMFLCAQSASAATAALGFAGYLLSALDVNSQLGRIGLGLAGVVLLIMLVLSGIRQLHFTIWLVVGLTLGSLFFFVAAGLPRLAAGGIGFFEPFFPPPAAGVSPVRALFHAAALMFVAYTGYGRIVALGDEARDPKRTIPRAIVVTLALTMLIYGAVAAVAVGNVGADAFAEATAGTAAPLEVIAEGFGIPGAGWVLAIGAVTAMLSVLFHLILGLSRVMLVMGRRRDMPPAVARVDRMGQTPETAVIAVGVVIAVLVLIGDVRITWSLSAFTALVYYAITNLTAYQLPADKRSYPRLIAAAGMLASLFLAFWVEPAIWITGLLLILLGLIWRWTMRKL